MGHLNGVKSPLAGKHHGVMWQVIVGMTKWGVDYTFD
jgi:hypothetical protein